MANTRWLGRAVSQAHIVTFTLTGTWAANDTATLTIGGVSLTLTTDGTTIEEVVDGLVAMVNGANLVASETRNAVGSDHAVWDGITASKSGTDTLVLTADDEGVPFTVTGTETTAGSGAVNSPTTSQAATGPNDVNNADNWSEGSVPSTGDDAYVGDTDVSLLYSLDQLSGNTLTSFTVAANFTGDIGLPKENEDGYTEYREDYLQIDCTTVRIGVGDGGGTGRIKIDAGSVQTTLEVLSTGGEEDAGIGAVVWKGTHASNVVDVKGGSVSIAPYGGETATVATLRVSGGALVYVSEGTSLTTGQNVNSTVQLQVDCTTLTQDGAATTFVTDTAAVTTYNLYGGIGYYNSSGTIGTLNLGGSPITATLDASGDRRGKTITNLNASHNSQINDPAQTITYTNGMLPAGRTAAIAFQ